ncbi:GNAT family N-acetyltransferase [Paenibacillus sp. HGF5]|uniref:GNAT family N-acetyltransferase n=1 Tax=Paenibacillus sp. HGF5 TaxID=908341 RepID=UPI0002072527|nr:GNAT family N-acetyltransferase [Paenibacillus sp. HGF5]EGG31384.1 conserved domain protein [Paenibacillus sp. HGF5]
MEISCLSLAGPEEWPHARQQCSEFFRRYSSKRLTREGYQRLASLSYEELLQPGTSIVAATVRGDIGRIPVGICFAADYGESACMIAVHPLYRNRQIGSSLIRSQLSRFGRLRCKVAADHTASLQMCFHAGMQAIALEQGPTGKPTLIMSGILPLHQSFNADSIQEGEPLCRNPS